MTATVPPAQTIVTRRIDITGRPRRSQRRSARAAGVLYTLPVIALLALVVFLPLAQALYFSFTNWNGATATWVGIRNFSSILSQTDLQRTLINSLLILGSIPFGMVFPFIVAYLLSGNMPGGRLFRSLIFAPTALSWVVIGVVARSFFANEGPVNATLDVIGLGALSVNWLADPTAALIAILVTFNASVFGVNTIIFLTGMASIDRSVIEAARVDGASATRVLVSIVMPAMRRFVEFVFTITVVLSFTGLFGLIYVMTAGGPGSATTTLEFAVWKRAFASGDFGLAAALGIVLMIITLGVIGLTRLSKKSGEPE